MNDRPTQSQRSVREHAHTTQIHQQHSNSSPVRNTAAPQRGGSVYRKPRRKRRRISRRMVLMLLLFVVFCVSVYMLLRMLIQYGKSRREYAELNAIAVSTVEPNRLSVSETPVLQEPLTGPSDSESISGSLPWEDQEKLRRKRELRSIGMRSKRSMDMLPRGCIVPTPISAIPLCNIKTMNFS